ncbi:hypothetical protein ACN38_g13007 [Penicillium nordicum]|uniref:Uncharacterized protein n=1 Tax=Penicillium nordicum TaxID=229535 RepID=A0A0M9W9D4_9EURO|nr:hypothetical protein ACN38_g13007 [Penicillium nordicum]
MPYLELTGFYSDQARFVCRGFDEFNATAATKNLCHQSTNSVMRRPPQWAELVQDLRPINQPAVGYGPYLQRPTKPIAH